MIASLLNALCLQLNLLVSARNSVVLVIAVQLCAYSVRIETTKEYVKFSVVGELGSGSTLLRAKESDKEEQRVTLDVQ
jgi:hypothetical protein